jgi:hypothetical protein
MYILTIYAPMIYTASCIMFWMRAYPLRGEVGGGWALEFESFLGPVKWHPADCAIRCIGCFMHTRLLATLTVFVGSSRAHTVGGGGAGE